MKRSSYSVERKLSKRKRSRRRRKHRHKRRKASKSKGGDGNEDGSNSENEGKEGILMNVETNSEDLSSSLSDKSVER